MSINSNQKGKRYERKAAQMLVERGICEEARRSQQYAGAKVEGAGDLQTSMDKYIRFEVKGGYNDLNINSAQVLNWVRKGMAETPEGRRFVLLWKKSRMDWVAIVPTHPQWYADDDELYIAAFTSVQEAITLAVQNFI